MFVGSLNLVRLTFVGILCSSKAGREHANLDNFVASCGLVYGAPNRVDGNSSPIVFEPGSNGQFGFTLAS